MTDDELIVQVDRCAAHDPFKFQQDLLPGPVGGDLERLLIGVGSGRVIAILVAADRVRAARFLDHSVVREYDRPSCAAALIENGTKRVLHPLLHGPAKVECCSFHLATPLIGSKPPQWSGPSPRSLPRRTYPPPCTAACPSPWRHNPWQHPRYLPRR